MALAPNMRPDEVEYVREHYGRFSNRTIAKLLGRSVASVARVAGRLGLTRAQRKRRAAARSGRNPKLDAMTWPLWFIRRKLAPTSSYNPENCWYKQQPKRLKYGREKDEPVGDTL